MCASRLRSGIFIEGEVDLHVRSDGRSLTARSASPDNFEFDECINEALANLESEGECTEAVLQFGFVSEVDLDGVMRESIGERGDWVFRSPPSRPPPFSVEARGLATRHDGEQIGRAAFVPGLETCFADAAYAALANEATFAVDTPLLIEYQPQDDGPARIDVLRSPAPHLSACVRDLPWPSTYDAPEPAEAPVRIRVDAHLVLKEQLVAALRALPGGEYRALSHP